MMLRIKLKRIMLKVRGCAIPKTRALLRLERTMNLFGGREGRGGREGGKEGGCLGGREGGRDDCYTYSNRYVQ